MRTIGLGVFPTVHNEETSTMWCGIIESSCNGNDTQSRRLYLLEGHACCLVWHVFCVYSRFACCVSCTDKIPRQAPTDFWDK